MVLTPRGEELANQIDMLCIEIEEIFATPGFDPAATERLFTIASHDFQVFSIGPRLIALFADAAPGFTLRFVGVGPDLPQRFASRDVDFAMLPDFQLNEIGSTRLQHMHLTLDGTVVLMRAGHPLSAYPAITRTHLKQYKQIGFHPDWEPIDYRKKLLIFRRNLPIHARVAQITLLPFFLVDTDFIGLVPDSLAEQFGRALGLVHRPLAFEQQTVRSVLAWSPIQETDQAHRWFRDRIASKLVPTLPAIPDRPDMPRPSYPGR